MSNPPDHTYWRRKLSAYMHDNPEKAFDLAGHEERAAQHSSGDQFFLRDYYDKQSDVQAAAADRFPFPSARHLHVRFDGGAASALRHPLGGAVLPLKAPFKSVDEAGEIASATVPHILPGDMDAEASARAEFICRWRFWRDWASDRDERMALLPADTRIPDHTIWNHLSLTSAIEGCTCLSPQKGVSLLLFSVGPVQSLIAAARNIRDLWSGSFLLSYLMASAMKPVLTGLGPDHLLFPSANGQPLCDLMLKDVYEGARFASVESGRGGTAWDQVWNDENPECRALFLTPSLPNRFLALVPAGQEAEIARQCESAMRSCLREIAESVVNHVDLKLGRDVDDARLRTDRMLSQVNQSLEVHWQTFSVPQSFDASLQLAASLLPGKDATDASKRIKKAWDCVQQKGHHPYELRPTQAWTALFAVLQWLHDGVKQTRAFDAWAHQSSWSYGAANQKDSLTGKEEFVYLAPADEEAAKEESARIGGGNSILVRPGESLGGLSLIKRLWHLTWLTHQHSFKREDFRMPNLHQLAKNLPFANDEKDELEGEGYIAVLAMDGDSMGQWISGALTPPLGEQLADAAREYFCGLGTEMQSILDAPRPLNPSFHLQFSEALGNFSVQAARLIVEAHCGRLIYAGGDDVLAVLPAPKAIRCATALQAAFKGDSKSLRDVRGVWRRLDEDDPEHVEDQQLFEPDVLRGLIKLSAGTRLRLDHRETTRRELPYIMPGPRANVSCGIAFGHAKSPIQDLVREAQKAEKTAKSEYGRPAIAVSIFKRSGETIKWGARWGQDAAPGAEAPVDCSLGLLALLRDSSLSSRFPYKLIQRLEPYVRGPSSDVDAQFASVGQSIVRRELQHTLSRDEGSGEATEPILALFDSYWGGLSFNDPVERIQHFIGLLQTMAWLNKSKNGASPEPQS